MDAERWGDYTVVKRLGEGGMAVVYLAHPHDIPDHRVVLKELKDARHGERFKGEARNLARLRNHPNICHLYHFFPRGEKTVLVTEYIEGATLDEIVRLDSRLDVSTILQIGMDILDVLAFAHEKRIYHRDLKPSNIMVDVEGRIKVIDFGIAKFEDDPDQTVEGAFVGTPHFAPPEQFRHDSAIDWAQCDLYALGSTLYYALTGRLPFNESSPREIAEAKRISDPPRPSEFNKDTPPDLDRILLRSLARRPEERYASAEEMRADLSQLRSSMLIPQTTLVDTVEWALSERVAKSSGPVDSTPRKGTLQRRSRFTRWAVMTTVATVIAFLLIFDPAGWFGPRPDGPAAARGIISLETDEVVGMMIDDSLTYSSTLAREINWDTGQYMLALFPHTKPVETTYQSIHVAPSETTTVAYSRSGQSKQLTDEPSADTVTLPIIASQSFEFTLSVDQPVDVYWDGRRLAKAVMSATISDEQGSYVLELRDSDSPDRSFVDTIELGGLKQLSRAYQDLFVLHVGELRVGSMPLGALIRIDGVIQTERTPYTFKLEPGSHEVSVAYETQGLVKDTVLEVRRGNVTEYFVEF